MDSAALPLELKSGSIAPVWLLYGPETFLREQSLAALQSAEPKPGFQVIRFATSEATWPMIADELYTAPFLGGRKLIVLLDEGNFIHNHLPQVKEYAAQPSTSAVLVALIPSEKAPGVPESKVVRHVECRPLRLHDMTRWIGSEFQRRGKTVDREAVDALLSRGGDTMLEMTRHVEMLSLYAGSRTRITQADVDLMVMGEPEHESYELALAVAGKQAAKSLEIVHRLLASGESAQFLLWKIAWQYRKIVEAKKLLESGKRRFEVTSMLQITFYPDQFLGLVDGHSLAELLEKHGEILQADVAMKTTGGSERAIMERLVLRLARAG